MSRALPAPTSASPADVLDRAIAALPDAPPPPPLERVWVPGAEARTLEVAHHVRLGTALRVAASVLVVGGAIGWGALDLLAVRTERAHDRAVGTSVGEDAARLTPLDASLVRVERGNASVPAFEARAGDTIAVLAASVVTLDGRARVAIDADARLTLAAPGEVGLDQGLATFDVSHDGTRSFLVRAGRVTVLDLGTRFAIDRTGDGTVDRVHVTVETGRVEANGTALGAGEGLAFHDGVAVGLPYRLDARPRVTLEVEDAAPRAGQAIVLRVVLANPTDAWLGWPALSPSRSPLMIDVVDPAGVPSTVRVTRSMVVSGEGAQGTGLGAIPPRGSQAVRVRFERTFASPGTYRLRAVYRPAGAVESPTSPEILMEVR